jgi:nicotinamide riboside kinase
MGSLFNDLENPKRNYQDDDSEQVSSNYQNSAFNDVIKKYKNDYFRHCVIEHHLTQLNCLMQKSFTNDEKEAPYGNHSFVKELADLHILLEFEKIYNPDFKRIIESRRERFISKLEK